jgi:transcription antitermination factor NusG
LDSYLSRTDDIVQEVIGVDNKGNPIEVSQINKAHELREKIYNKILKIESELKATRKSKDGDMESITKDHFARMEAAIERYDRENKGRTLEG